MTAGHPSKPAFARKWRALQVAARRILRIPPSGYATYRGCDVAGSQYVAGNDSCLLDAFVRLYQDTSVGSISIYEAARNPCCHMLKSSRHSKITGNFGEALILYWLSKRGFECANVDHTGIDLIARRPSSQEVLGISVKCRSRTEARDEAGVNLLHANDKKIEDTCRASVRFCARCGVARSRKRHGC